LEAKQEQKTTIYYRAYINVSGLPEFMFQVINYPCKFFFCCWVQLVILWNNI